MVGSLLGFFFYVSTAFTVIMVSMFCLFDDSTLEKVRHYPRPIVAVAATKNAPQPPKQASLAKSDSRVVSIAKADTEKTKREKPARLHKPKVLARQHEKYDGNSMVLSYAGGYGLGVSSVAERIFTARY